MGKSEKIKTARLTLKNVPLSIVASKANPRTLLALSLLALTGFVVLTPLPPGSAQAPRPALTARAGGFGTSETGGARSPARPISNEPFACQLLNERGQAVHPSAIVRGNGQIFLLSADCLYMAAAPLPKPDLGGVLNLKTYPKPAFSQTPNTPGALAIPVHEFVNLLYCPLRQSVFVLDKSGDLFEFDPTKKTWAILRANLPGAGSPDPEYIDFCLSPSGNQPSGGPNQINGYSRLNLLDPERNQIWKLALKKSGDVPPQVKKSFAEVMPWRVKRGDPSVAESIALTYDSIFYVLRNFSQSGQIAMISPVTENLVLQTRLVILGIHGIRPTRMLSQAGAPLYIVERENNRVLAVDKKSGATRPFLFQADSDLRGLTPDAQGFWVINGAKLTYRSLAKPDSLSAAAAKPPARTIDERLKTLTMPIVGMTLPRHAGVYPGARRLYRYGVHEGMDFFYGGGRAKIYMGSPVVAAGNGKIIRADANFQDMNQATFNRVMADCVREHRTSDKNEDLLRGCQVWIDHGSNMITRYAHLNKINSKIKVGQTVKRGDLLGFVGVSGTGQNLPGKAKYPHLHFEIWLDGKYLGYGLTPAETVGIFENIFGTGT
jgi:murein DD-endopeptidase MepM/ murein hydrolase activator NlpD